jgi:hypothetical protein
MYKRRVAEADISLNFDCPTCGAGPQEKCELNSGAPRFASHAERWDIAKQYQPKPRADPDPSARKPRTKKGPKKPRSAAKSK